MVTITKYVWDPVFDCVTHELDENNNVKAEYHNEPQQYGGVLSQRRGTISHYHHHDALGSTRFLTDNSGNVTDTYLHDAWGNSVATTGTTVNPFKWVGKYGYYTDDTTAKVYVRARMYQPIVARWSSVDPLGYFDGVNLHIYADNVAPQKIDPTGLYCICCTFEQAEVIFSTDVCGSVNAVDLCKQEAKLRSDASFGKYPVKVLSVGKNRCNVVAQDKYWLCGMPVQQSGRIVEDCVANCTGAEHVSIGIGDAFPLTEGRGGKGGVYCCNKAGANVCRLSVKNGGQMKSRWDNPHWPGKPCWLATDADIRECLLKSKEKSPVFRHVTDNCQVDVWNTGWDCCLDMHDCGDMMPAKDIEFCCPGTVFGY